MTYNPNNYNPNNYNHNSNNKYNRNNSNNKIKIDLTTINPINLTTFHLITQILKITCHLIYHTTIIT